MRHINNWLRWLFAARISLKISVCSSVNCSIRSLASWACCSFRVCVASMFSWSSKPKALRRLTSAANGLSSLSESSPPVKLSLLYSVKHSSSAFFVSVPEHGAMHERRTPVSSSYIGPASACSLARATSLRGAINEFNWLVWLSTYIFARFWIMGACVAL